MVNIGRAVALLLCLALAAGCGGTPASAPQPQPDPATAPQLDGAAVDASKAAPAETAAQTPGEPVVEFKAALPATDMPLMSHVWQSMNNCGPAAVVMALSTLGIDESQEVARLALRGPDVARGMGPGGVDAWVAERHGVRAMWRTNGTNTLLKTLVTNGFAPMVTQWMQDPNISRISHWRTVRGYDDARGLFLVNDSMLGRGVQLKYDWFGALWQPFSYRYMVVYRSEDEPKLRSIVGDDWDAQKNRRGFYERAKVEADAWQTPASYLALGEAAYQYGRHEEAVAAFEKALAVSSPTGVFWLRSSYPNALRALGRNAEADEVAKKLQPR